MCLVAWPFTTVCELLWLMDSPICIGGQHMSSAVEEVCTTGNASIGSAPSVTSNKRMTRKYLDRTKTICNLSALLQDGPGCLLHPLRFFELLLQLLSHA